MYNPEGIHGLPGGRFLRQRIGELRSPGEFLDAVDGFFSQLAAEGADLSAEVPEDAGEPIPERAGKADEMAAISAG